MWNVKDFLQLGVYTPSQVKQAEPGAKKEEELVVQHQSVLDPTKNASFLVVDSVTKIQPQDWSRVIAVFTTGQAWQFNGWPYPHPTQCFDHACPFYLGYDDEPLPPKIQEWRVNRLLVSKHKRYADRSVATEFWRAVATFVQASKDKGKHLFF